VASESRDSEVEVDGLGLDGGNVGNGGGGLVGAGGGGEG